MQHIFGLNFRFNHSVGQNIFNLRISSMRLLQMLIPSLYHIVTVGFKFF
jgi:hypothetical protein